MVKEFRDFVMRGNVIDLAVAVVIAGAFLAVINAFVADILTPLLGIIGIPDFSTWTFQLGNAILRFGEFLNVLISFVIIAACVFFLIVKPMNAIVAGSKKKQDAAPAGPSEIDLLKEIRDELRKRPA